MHRAMNRPAPRGVEAAHVGARRATVPLRLEGSQLMIDKGEEQVMVERHRCVHLNDAADCHGGAAPALGRPAVSRA
jgi:hypothetical protein